MVYTILTKTPIGVVGETNKQKQNGEYMSKHTPAPWVYDSFALREEIRSESNPLIAVVSSVHCSSPEQMRDNARLIAAAPELLEALEALLNEPTNAPDYLPTKLWDRAREAVAKAKGG